MKEWRGLRLIVAAIITFVWAVAYIVSVVHPATHPPPEISTVMIIVVTWLFAAEAGKFRKNGSDK